VLWLKRSRYGLAMRAAAMDQETAMAQGIDVGRVVALSWAPAGALAAVGGGHDDRAEGITRHHHRRTEFAHRCAGKRHDRRPDRLYTSYAREESAWDTAAKAWWTAGLLVLAVLAPLFVAKDITNRGKDPIDFRPPQ
jgi:hypothetical protein